MRDDEAYIHFQECINDLISSLKIMDELEGAVICATIWNAAYQKALIDYAKPFKQSRGKDERRIPPLPFPLTPAADFKFHEKLLKLRDTFLAHNDLSEDKDAKLFVNVNAGPPLPVIISNTDPLLPDLSVVKAHVKRILHAWCSQLEVFEQQFGK